jgi:type IV secretion system protein VirD4
VNDVDTAKYIVERLGKTTIVSRSGGTNWNESRQPGSNGAGMQRSCSWGGNDGWQEAGRELLQVNEVMGLSERVALSFVPGVPPIWTTLVRYYEEGSEQRPGGFWPALRAFGEALCWLAAVGFFAVVLTGIIYQR